MLNLINQNMKRWISAWFQILDCLVCILTLEFYYTETVYRSFSVKEEHPMSIKSRIRWWIFDWISVFEEVLVILSLGVIRTSVGIHFLDWSS